MTIRERIAGYKAAIGPTVVGELRMALNALEGAQLAVEIGPEAFRFPHQVKVALAKLKQAGEQPTDPDLLLRWASNTEAALRVLWDAIEGQDVDGVTIIRRRAA